MTHKQPQQNTPQAESSLPSVVLGRIEKESLSPRARWQFLAIDCVIWGAWLVTVVLGAMSVAVLLYMGGYAWFALYEATHPNSWTFFFDILPYIWISMFVCMGILAYFNMRHTKRGYKYPLWWMVVSSVVLSVIGGIALHMLGIGYMIDTQMDKTMPNYVSLEHSEAQVWQHPAEGRLLGVFSTMDEKDELYVFTDTNTQQWSIQTIELRVADRELLSSGSTVRVLGTITDEVQGLFHACGVFPWMFDADVSIDDMKNDRRAFVEKMYEHMENGDRLTQFEQEVFAENEDMPFGEGICADLAVIKRMHF